MEEKVLETWVQEGLESIPWTGEPDGEWRFWTRERVPSVMRTRRPCWLAGPG